MNKTFVEFSADFERVLDMCYDATVSDEEIQTARAQLEGELTEKISDLRRNIQTLKAIVDRTESEIKRLEQYKDEIDMRVDFLCSTHIPF